MDHSPDSRMICTSTDRGGSVLEPELPLSGGGCPTSLTEGTILLQLVEFKSHLVEVVEELHIRRDAETRFEDQISQLVLHKQELEWEKESLQRQTETAAKKHAEALVDVQKQFQSRMKSLEEEKGKYQVSVELKDEEINNLKDELKSLQLLKYNLEKKTSELEHKLALQSKSKDSHLNQLGEVEKRFSVLSRQCAVVKRAHEKLEHNVHEAIKRNEALTSAKAQQEATIVSLQKELEDANHKLIKVKMSSVVKELSCSSTDREPHVQQLQERLRTETQVNKALMEENVSAREEKREVMRCLEFTQQLLLSQTQAVSRVELELQTHREQYQALKQEHEVACDGTRAAQDKLAQLMESHAAARTSWATEKAELLVAVEAAQQELQGVNRAHNELQRTHEELCSQAAAQARLLFDLEERANQGCQVCSNPFTTDLVCEPSTRSAALKPERVSETGAGALPAASGAAEGPDGQVSQMQHYQQPESEQHSNPSDSLANNKNELDDLPLPDSFRNNSLCETLIKPAAECSSDRPLDDHNDVGWTAGWSGDANQSFSEHEECEKEANCDGCSKRLDTKGTGGAQTAHRAAESEDDQRSAGETLDSGQNEGDTEDIVEGAGSHGVEERRKTEPLVQQAVIPTQTAAADEQQVVDLLDTGEEEGRGREREIGLLMTLLGESETRGDTEQMQPTSSPGDTQQREEANGSTSVESLVDHQVSPGEDVGTSVEEHQLAEVSAAPHQHPDDCQIAESRAPHSHTGHITEFSTSDEEDKAASDEEENEQENNEAQSSQGSPDFLLPTTGCSGKTTLEGDRNRLALDWHSVPRKQPSPSKSSGFSLHKFVQDPTWPEQNTCSLSLVLGDKHYLTPTSTSVPLQSAPPPLRPSPSSASSAMIFSSLPESAESSMGRHQQCGDGKEGTRVPAAANNKLYSVKLQEHRDSGSTSSVVSPKSSVVFSRPPATTLSRPNRAPSSSVLSKSDTEITFSQEQGAQQAALRAQISKIEQFLNNERLRSVKRPRSDS